MRHLTLRRTALPLLAALSLSGFAAGLPAEAAPAKSPYTAVDTTFAFDGQPYAGDYVACPEGTSAVSSGARVDVQLANGVLLNLLTTWKGDGSYATGLDVEGDGHVYVHLHCTETARLQGSRLVKKRVTSAAQQDPALSARASCPRGTIAYGGGGFVSEDGAVDPEGLPMFAAFPTKKRWAEGRYGFLGERELWVSTHCLPREGFGRIAVVDRTVRADDPQPKDYTGVSATARCPSGTIAFAGGAWLHKAGRDEPAPRGYLTASEMVEDDAGWSASALVAQRRTSLTTRVLCTDTLGVT